MSTTDIEWTDRVWNPVTGCTKVSAGCKHCYAETVANRFWRATEPPILTATVEGETARPRRFTDVQCHEDRLTQPLRWRKPSRVFVNSMSDLFHEDVPDDFIERVFSVMGLAERHTFQVLTKRPARMRAWFSNRRFDVKNHAILKTEIADGGAYSMPWPFLNVQLGVSVEDPATADERIPLLLQTPAAVRFVSLEPLLSHVSIEGWLDTETCIGACYRPACGGCAPHLDWVIVGGESGPHARPCDVAWIRLIVQQCVEAGTPVFVKQLGTRPVASGPLAIPSGLRVTGASGGTDIVFRDRKGADIVEWPEDLRVRQYPSTLVSTGAAS